MSSKQYFNGVANQWDTMRKGFFPEAVRETAFSIADVQPGTLAADIGAGTGFITEGLIQKGLNVIAVDQSEAMLMEMQKNSSDTGRLECRQGTAEQLPVKERTMDYVFANMYLHHVETPYVAIAEMKRILKPGGRLIITDLDEHQSEFLRTEQFDRWMGFHRDDISRWFQAVDLTNIKIDCVDESCCASSRCNCEEASITIFAASGERDS